MGADRRRKIQARKTRIVAARQVFEGNPAFAGFDDLRAHPPLIRIRGKHSPVRNINSELIQAFRLRSNRRQSFTSLIGVRRLSPRTASASRPTLLGGKRKGR